MILISLRFEVFVHLVRVTYVIQQLNEEDGVDPCILFYFQHLDGEDIAA